MKPTIYLVYISLSGNTESFVKRLKGFFQFQTDWQVEPVHVKDLVKQDIPFYQLDAPFVAFLPTYLEGGNGVDNGDVEILTNPLGDFIAFGDNAELCLGVVGSGNRNFNNQYCLTAKQYAERFGFPVIDNFELRGLQNDIERIGHKIIALMEEKA
ncbi:class Ib ribonucleoside-diphosphate reductase assembly flavoprotein NrdI [Streptococcus suis]|uniref:Putative NrdI-like protein n=2 Tax=Streptococcus TaxID=1301 RepID=A0A4V4RXX1_STRSU|nr:class Ib ribonucleoside-diphosphate reductase assembly flavoprotein NrdI [Streptococcus sp. 29896]MBL6537890.1 class Ib ribonucleoside-diphosphate reductase assembly flavoprotein NrdI [Streptococcus suis]MBM7270041.1 class Ib ribonucleoside-diphosphate reductase assembly flavoprotein NrdI [Streptococcus suis]MBM7314418.1 class Ib ribonucleoside-diphosphate reductase assembly flavoprotein NrdI [Streptococcus suis]MCK4027384.1 class Ib ribonucleoside-diphosphate reductase assembly flavoprotein